MSDIFLKLYRMLPSFKGKLRLGKLLFSNHLNKETPVEFVAHKNIKYKIPNTIENLGIELLINGIYEKEIVSFLKSIVNDGNVFFDIGANIGSIGIPIAKSGNNIKYWGFEASPETFPYLEYNVQNNEISHCNVYNNLIHENSDQKIKFYQSVKYGKSSLAPSYSDEFVYVNSITIDSICEVNNITTIDVMKVDVQGFELFVFKGMQNLLQAKKVRNILFEFEGWAEKNASLETGSAQQYLKSMDYGLYNIKGEKLKNVLTEGELMIWAKPN